MPKVKIMLSSMNDISFSQEKIFDLDDESWEDSSREQRQAMIDEIANDYRNEVVDWDYQVVG